MNDKNKREDERKSDNVKWMRSQKKWREHTDDDKREAAEKEKGRKKGGKEEGGSRGGMFATSIVSQTGREAGVVLLRHTSVEKQEARGPAHPHGQLVPSDSCSPLPVSHIQWFPP